MHNIMNSQFVNRNVIVTGGLGFIGSNLVRKLVELGAKVLVIDSLIPEYGGNLFNIHGIENRLSLNISDVRDIYSMRYLIQNYDLMFNLAGQTSHMDSMNDPFTDLEINCKAQLSILEACRLYNPTIKIIFASTRQVYGRPIRFPVSESHPIQPVDINGVNKLAGEWFHILYNDVYGIKSCALRLTNTYGPRMRIKDSRQTFLGIWIKSIIQGKPFEVWGGDQLRDFNYVDDVVEALLLTASNNNVNGKVLNLGGDYVVSLQELANILSELSGCNYKTIPYPDDRKKIDIGDYYADYSQISSLVGWEPRTSLRDGLLNTIQFYSQHINYYL